jgi:membrane-bound lytic murein transglycosylase MltF
MTASQPLPQSWMSSVNRLALLSKKRYQSR